MNYYLKYIHRSVSVISYCTESGILALNKNIGILSHPNLNSNNNDNNKSLFINCKYDHINEANHIPIIISDNNNIETQPLYLLHRLDKATSGVILLCDQIAYVKIIKDMLKHRHNISKTYYALSFYNTTIHKISINSNMVWEDSLSKHNNTTTVRVTSNNHNTNKSNVAITKVELIKLSSSPISSSFKNTKVCLLKLTPITGYTHQLRYQCALHGVPIVGDDVYGDFILNKEFNRQSMKAITNVFNQGSHKSNGSNTYKRLYLHAYSYALSISHMDSDSSNSSSGKHLYEAPLPKEFTYIMTR